MSALVKLGIDRFAAERKAALPSPAQEQTRGAFSFKWAQRQSYESPAFQANVARWLFERYCDNQPERLAGWLAGGRKIILDAGCGSGNSAIPFFGELLKEHDYLGVDISDAVEVAARRFAAKGYPADFLQCDLLHLPIADESVDMIFSEGVLHHTDSTRRSVEYLAKKLKRGGRFLFYVYAKKGPIREFTDDHIRRQILEKTDEEAWEAIKPLTRLGIVLGELNVTVNVPEAIPLLDIPAGQIDLQRLFYWHVAKMFYRPEFSFDEMHHINFDWFRPANCQRHTPDEVLAYCAGASLEVEHLNVQPSGITVVARKR